VAWGRGISFLRSGLVVRVMFCFLWCAVGVVGEASGLINLEQLYSHTGNNLLGGLSELMTTCVDRSFSDSLVFSLFFRSGEISFSVCHWHSLLSTTILAAGVRWLF
jgi:hypothetical protein